MVVVGKWLDLERRRQKGRELWGDFAALDCDGPSCDVVWWWIHLAFIQP